MPAPPPCYLCDRICENAAQDGEAPLCKRCALEALTAATEAWGGYASEEKTDPGVGPVFRGRR